ncbi:MAG: hypothetical protein IKY91_05950 [Akkermansia sp.]|nr:hypothetical protein [Akkermansia sp.]
MSTLILGDDEGMNRGGCGAAAGAAGKQRHYGCSPASEYNEFLIILQAKYRI